MAKPTTKPPCLTGLPVEILLDIYHQLELDSVFDFAAAHRSLHDLFEERKATILLPILARDFSPFDELLQVYTASRGDLETIGGLYAPRRIVFQRYPGDDGIALAPQPDSWPVTPADGPLHGFTKVLKTGKVYAAPSSTIKTAILTERDLGYLLNYCRIVRGWEERFPQMRWLQEPENCRFLRFHEAERFRRAFYRWWLYGFYFHGDFPRPRVGLPEPYVDDVRTSQMRRHSTSELLELMDLVETMKDVVLHYLCPRLDPYELNDCDSPLIDTVDRPQSLLTGWTDQSPWGRIVKTYAKLGPKELMHLFENIYSYPRGRLIVEAKLNNPTLTFDQESIQVAIRCALDERRWLDKMPSLPEDSAGGIIDFDDERDNERLTFCADARLDGSLPLGAKFERSFSQYSPRGDDGSYIGETQQQDRVGAQVSSVYQGFAYNGI